MKIAIITITEDSRKLANRLAESLKSDPTVIEVKIFNKNVKGALKESFKDYDCIIGIMASGIIVRNICRLIKNKMEDPAVLLVDDQGKHVISLLSGHFGGANEITLKIAHILGAEPVITTATDTHGKMGIDSIARKYHLNVDDFSLIKRINSALVENKKVDLCVCEKYKYIMEDFAIKESYNECSRDEDDLKVSYKGNTLLLTPKKVVFGIGARRGVKQENVLTAIYKAAELLELPPHRIDSIATAKIKEKERGIIEAASNLQVPLEIVSTEEIKSLNNPDCSSSPLVLKNFGIPGVCEQAALIAAGSKSRLILKKTAYNGVTVAVAVSKS